MQNPCPICSEVLFDSVKEISTLECGHAIHRKCLQQAFDCNVPVCLVCQRTADDDSHTMDIVLKAFAIARSLQFASEDADGHCRNCRAMMPVRHVHTSPTRTKTLYSTKTRQAEYSFQSLQVHTHRCMVHVLRKTSVNLCSRHRRLRHP